MRIAIRLTGTHAPGAFNSHIDTFLPLVAPVIAPDRAPGQRLGEARLVAAEVLADGVGVLQLHVDEWMCRLLTADNGQLYTFGFGYHPPRIEVIPVAAKAKDSLIILPVRAIALALAGAGDPARLPEAPALGQGAAIEARMYNHATVRPCLRCKASARVSYIAVTEHGHRWIDLCPPCDLAFLQQAQLLRDTVIGRAPLA